MTDALLPFTLVSYFCCTSTTFVQRLALTPKLHPGSQDHPTVYYPTNEEEAIDEVVNHFMPQQNYYDGRMVHPQQQQQPIYNQNQHFYQQQQQHAPAALSPQYPVLPQHPVLPQQQPAHLVNPPTHQRDGLHQVLLLCFFFSIWTTNPWPSLSTNPVAKTLSPVLTFNTAIVERIQARDCACSPFSFWPTKF